MTNSMLRSLNISNNKEIGVKGFKHLFEKLIFVIESEVKYLNLSNNSLGSEVFENCKKMLDDLSDL